jgi:hypothetical protein
VTPISTDHIFVVGDDSSGESDPHSTAFVIGKKTVLSCAHSLALASDSSKMSTRGKSFFVYVEDYWIQPSVSIGVDGKWNNDERIPVKLYKFHPDNDWALFVRADGNEFTSFAKIDMTPSTLPPRTLPNVSKPMVILHCPVGLLHNFTERCGEYTVSCNKTMNCVIQSQSSHHIYYEGSNLVRGSSGGAVQWVDSNLLFAMHCEVINEAMFDEEYQNKEIAYTSKLVISEDDPYPQVVNPPKKQKTCESETIRSLSGGNQGQGRAIIVSRFKRLIHYLEEIEQLP